MKKGFTLIELLAVLVILAIIALIAIPIILGIINDAREKANERSVELYASAVKNGIAAYQLLEGKGVAAGTYTSETLPFEVEYDGDVECTSIILSEDSKVSLDGCKVNGGEKTYNYGLEEETPELEEETTSLAGTMGICKPAIEQLYETKQPLEAGYKYECDVDPNKQGYDQSFYVLNYSDENGNITNDKTKAKSINLIMDSNIRTGGEAVKEKEPTSEQKGYVAWVSKTDYTREDIGGSPTDYGYGNGNKGPITAIEYLQSATSGWTNVNPQIISTFDSYDYDYVDNIKYVATHSMAKTYTLNARMPYLSEVSNYSESANNAYLYDNLEAQYCDDELSASLGCPAGMLISGLHEEGMTHVLGVCYYWTFSPSDGLTGAFDVNHSGSIGGQGVGGIGGVRPVINLSI